MSKGRQLRVGAFQFACTADPTANARAIVRGIRRASRCGVQLLATQECALCGYPPIDVPSSSAIDPVQLGSASLLVAEAVRDSGIRVLLGTAIIRNSRVYNAITLLGPRGASHAPYTKRALYGWDRDNFAIGDGSEGIYSVLGTRVGIRICYEARFPEYFRELMHRNVKLAVVAFADCGGSRSKYEVMLSHLVSRAAENVMYLLSANSVSGVQNAPTCLIDPDGQVLACAKPGREALIHADVEFTAPNFGRRGRMLHSRRLFRLQSKILARFPADRAVTKH